MLLIFVLVLFPSLSLSCVWKCCINSRSDKPSDSVTEKKIQKSIRNKISVCLKVVSHYYRVMIIITITDHCPLCFSLSHLKLNHTHFVLSQQKIFMFSHRERRRNTNLRISHSVKAQESLNSFRFKDDFLFRFILVLKETTMNVDWIGAF